jgi:hypothetical protein
MSVDNNTIKTILTTVRALAVNVESNGNKLKLLANGQKAMMEKLRFLEDWAVTGSVSSKKAPTVPTIAGANLSRLEGSTSLLLQGLFTGAQVGDAMDGHKRASVYFRILTLNPYPKPSEIRLAFLDARNDVTVDAVNNWFDLNRVQILGRFRDRRSALVRYVKLAVAIELKVGKPPEEGGEGSLAQWKERCIDAWKSAKTVAKQNGLLYPEFVTKLLLHHAESADPYIDHPDPFIFVPEIADDATAAVHPYLSLGILEAYCLMIIALSFEAVLVQDPNAVQCSKHSINSASLFSARLIVKKQRETYRERARHLLMEEQG